MMQYSYILALYRLSLPIMRKVYFVDQNEQKSDDRACWVAMQCCHYGGEGTQLLVSYTCITRGFQNIPKLRFFCVMLHGDFCVRSYPVKGVLPSGFFTGGRGEAGFSQLAKIWPLVNPPIRHSSSFSDQSLSHSTKHLSQKMFTILVHFCIDFDYF